jgi:GGDEF domain-containing protein
VETYRVCHGGKEYSVGVSIGVTAIDGSEVETTAIVARADAACYAAKSRRRGTFAGE